jgi:hypothetical protein
MSTIDIDLSIQPTEGMFEIPKEIPLEELSQKKLREYLYALKKTAWTALTTMLLSIVVGVPALCALIEFLRTGGAFMHPYLAMFLTLGSIGLFSISVFSAFRVKSQLQSAVGGLLRVYQETL